MSRAFVRELDDQGDNAAPLRPQSPHINYVTPRGLGQLEDKVRDLAEARQALVGKEDLSSQQTLRELERELAYLNERVKRAVLVEPKAQPLDRVHFGALVEAEDKEGERLNFMIVGEDEVDARQGRISWVSPLANALMNAQVGDVVSWKRPVGDKELEVLSIRRV
ncbi:MAG: GreA/GreB family elongation factor [Methylococcaceae bacterium]|nr:GreA/GreB family elongation factor [Methylococcaceae bacterium]